MNTPPQLDKFDFEILKMVQDNNLTPHRAIAESIGLSVPSIARRLQKLRAAGVIASDQSILTPHLVGALLTIVVHIVVENEAMKLIDEMKRRFKNCPNVQQCYYVTGDIDFILIMSTRDMQEYTALTRSLFFEGGNVKHFRSFVTMERVKASLNVNVGRP
jgi:Lrp/AsnC family leucine-responsive transcriptional regulator